MCVLRKHVDPPHALTFDLAQCRGLGIDLIPKKSFGDVGRAAYCILERCQNRRCHRDPAATCFKYVYSLPK